jgi:signal transduction histidine kinase
MPHHESTMSVHHERRIILEDLTFRISHRVKAPIATMLGLLELIRIDAIREDEIAGVCLHFQGCVDELYRNSRELAAIVRQQKISH